MIARRNVWVLVAGLGVAVWWGSNEAFAQCSGGGGRGGRPTGSPGALNTASPYAVDPLLALRYSQNVLLAQQLQQQRYQQQLLAAENQLAAKNQLASARITLAEQQRQDVQRREDLARSYRLARAEARRAARAQRAAERLAALEEQEASPAVELAFVNTN